MANPKLGGDLFLLSLTLKQLAPEVVGKGRFKIALPAETLAALKADLEPHLIRETAEGFCAQGFEFVTDDAAVYQKLNFGPELP